MKAKDVNEDAGSKRKGKKDIGSEEDDIKEQDKPIKK